jgi:alkanesulfonate monooxygenase SsuD/methylene tetrahydromethanopterin reductase-like flavin-dependent oxidoreductase (luciferase family)
VLLGGAAPEALRRAGRLAQGWISSTRQDPASLAAAVEVVRAGAREAGRDEDGVRILVRVVVELLAEERDGPRVPFTGTREQVLDDVAALKGQGATEVLVDLNFSPRVGSPHVDHDAAADYADRVLEALAPAAWATA